MDLEELFTLIRDGESEKVEFKQKATKMIHKEITAFANALGGYIIIGVNDDGKIVGTDVGKSLEIVSSAVQSIIPLLKITTQKFKFDDKDILVLRVEKGDMLCSVGGVVYIRIGTSARPLCVQEILMLSSEMGTIQWDEAALLPLTDVKNDFLDWFFIQMEKTRGKTITEPDRDRYLRSAGAIRNKMLTNAGVLFFTDATEFLHHAKIRLIAIEHNEPVWSKEYEGPVWQVIDSAYTDLIREIKKIDVVIGAKRVKIEEYPPRALREAIINAVAHRNYTIHADVRIFIYPDMIKIKNPGGLLPGVDLDDPEHVPRNPAICNLLYDTGFIERYGFGIRLIYEETEKHPISSVTFNSTPNRFIVEFKKNLSTIMDDVDARILELVIDPMKSSNIASSIGVSKPTVIRRLKKLEQLRLVQKIGEGAHTRYIIRA